MTSVKKDHKSKPGADLPVFQWMANDGFHTLSPGIPPSPKEIEAKTKAYQKRIRKSPLWEMMVSKYGKKKAKEMLKEFRYEVRS